MPTLSVKAYRYILPVKAIVTVVDNDFWAKGDVNRDGVIDTYDLDKIKPLFGKSRGEPEFDPDCDLNGDGYIGIDDISIVASNLGLKAPSFITAFTTSVAPGKCVLFARYKGQTLRAELEMAEANTRKVTFLFLTFFSRSVIR